MIDAPSLRCVAAKERDTVVEQVGGRRSLMLQPQRLRVEESACRCCLCLNERAQNDRGAMIILAEIAGWVSL